MTRRAISRIADLQPEVTTGPISKTSEVVVRHQPKKTRAGVRVAYGNGLENRRRGTVQEFDSPSARHILLNINDLGC